MKKIAVELTQIIAEYSEKLSGISENDFSQKPSPEKWSRKEELGHLIDSAMTNLRRFVIAQYETDPKIVYDQNFFVNAIGYAKQPSVNLIALWKLLNQQIAAVLDSMPEKNYGRTCDTGKNTIELHTIEWLAGDYVKHLRHHLHHILGLVAIPY